MLRLLVAAGLLIAAADAYSSGPPSSVCTNAAMVPTGHPASTTANDPSPYGITVSAGEYSAGASLTVTLKGSASFRGFLILALPYDGSSTDAVGTFEAKNSNEASWIQPLCSGGAAHTSTFSNPSLGASELELKWNAPANTAGNIAFYVTFVKTQPEYWVKQASDPIWDGQGPRPVTTTAPPVTDPPELSPLITFTGCGDTKSCYHACDEDNNCDFLLTWKKKSTSEVEFELFASLAESENYVALGLSNTPTMFDVSIIGCTADDRRKSEVYQYYAASRVSPELLEKIDINNAEAAIQADTAPKTMSCRFTYNNANAKTHLNESKDLDTDLYLFVARGPAFGSAISKHTNKPRISPSAVKLTSDSAQTLTGTYVEVLLKAHACIMVLAWVFCASIGLILARYYKPMWADTKACGQKVWFSYHRALMLSAMFLTVIGFVIILVRQKGIFSTPAELPTKAHPILGLIAIICALLNPLIAAFRCHPGDSKRPIFNWVHWFFGTVAHVFAIVAIFLGMLITDVGVPTWITYVMMAFCLFHVCVEFILEIHQCCMYDKNRDRQEEYQMANKSGGGKEPPYAGRGFKCAMLTIYLIGTSIATIVIVVVIAIWGDIVGMVA